MQFWSLQDNYLRIITYKTAFYTFYLPVASGLVLAGETRQEAYDLAQQICVEMGQYFQVRDILFFFRFVFITYRRL